MCDYEPDPFCWTLIRIFGLPAAAQPATMLVISFVGPGVPRHDVYKQRFSAPPSVNLMQKADRLFAAAKPCTRKRTGFIA